MTAGTKTQELGINASADLDDQLANNFFSVGIDFSGSTTDECIHLITFNGTGSPKLIVSYNTSCNYGGAGDWIINDTCSFFNQGFTVSGNLHVGQTGLLNMTGSTSINFSGASRFIYVYSGGKIYMNSTSQFDR